jgi:hypothetical protein
MSFRTRKQLAEIARATKKAAELSKAAEYDRATEAVSTARLLERAAAVSESNASAIRIVAAKVQHRKIKVRHGYGGSLTYKCVSLHVCTIIGFVEGRKKN